LNVQPSADDWVWLARIRHPQGRKGEVFADILTDFPEKFSERKRLWLLGSNISGAIGGAGGPVRGLASHVGSASERASSVVDAAPREIELSAHWLHKGGIVLHFAGIDSISAAETLAGLIVAVPRAQRAALAEDEVYIGDLVGCVLVDVHSGSAIVVGEIEDVDRTAGPVPLLIVHSAKGEVLIPFAKSFLRRLDMEARRVEMALPEGLIDLNP